MQVRLNTNLGAIDLILDTEAQPTAVCNFIKLVKVGYYDWCLIHRVDRDFIIQTGDPTNTGSGGDSIVGVCRRKWQGPGDDSTVDWEYIAGKRQHVVRRKWQVAMVDMNGQCGYGSQFYFIMADRIEHLSDPIIGQVTVGQSILESINRAPVDADQRPMEGMAELWDTDPFPDPPNLPNCDYDRSKPSTSFLRHRRGLQARDAVTLEDEIRMHELKLEILGDEQTTASDKRLFIARLNPLTVTTDLRLIFSRFGEIRECEIVKDRETGKSLGYGFVEYKLRQDCEQAYERMQNVIIDDRKILVDFAHSAKRQSSHRRDRSPHHRYRSPQRSRSPYRRERSPYRPDRSPYRRYRSPYRGRSPHRRKSPSPHRSLQRPRSPRH